VAMDAFKQQLKPGNDRVALKYTNELKRKITIVQGFSLLTRKKLSKWKHWAKVVSRPLLKFTRNAWMFFCYKAIGHHNIS